jgi:WD40 repeat protein
MLNLALDSTLRGYDVVALRVEDVAPRGYASNARLVAYRSCSWQVPICGIGIVETETGRVPWELPPLVGPFAFSFDGKKLTLGSFKNIQICDVETLKERSRVELGEHELSPVSISFSPADHWLASGLDDGTVRIWRMR